MKGLFIFAFLFLISINSWAKTNIDANTTGLTDAQIAQINLNIAQLRNAAPTKPTVTQVSEWVGVFNELGGGMAIVAQKLGMTANELAKTPVGIFVMVIVAWVYIGGDIASFLFGFSWLVIAVPTWILLYYRRFVIASVEYYDKGARTDGNTKVKIYRSGQNDENIHMIYWISIIAIVLLGAIPIFMI